jgi:hypothetical protein
MMLHPVSCTFVVGWAASTPGSAAPDRVHEGAR